MIFFQSDLRFLKKIYIYLLQFKIKNTIFGQFRKRRTLHYFVGNNIFDIFSSGLKALLLKTNRPSLQSRKPRSSTA